MAAQPDPAPARTSAPSPSAPRVHPILRWAMRAYVALIAFLVLALLGNILLVPLAQSPDHWGDAVGQQVTTLLTVAQSYPLFTALGVLVLLALFGVCARAQAAWEAETKTAEGVRIASQVKTDVAADLPQMIEAAAQRATRAAPTIPLTVVSPSGLPRPATLVGRAEDLRKLMDGLRQGSSVGVFAIQGLGGVGKTALAAEALARLSQDTATFPGGAAWISCEGLSGPEGLSELWTRVARALQSDDVASLPAAEARRIALGAALHNPARPRLLLALDNIEPDLDANAILDTLAGGTATLLLTARQAVTPGRLQALPLAPLPDPDAGTLFAQRLRQADPARPTVLDTGAIPGVVALLGGLPLAVELEAAYAGIQHQDLSATTRELKEAGVAGTPLKALRTRFDRSWRVLTAAQQKLFAGLSIIEGATFPRAAALAVAQAALGGHEKGATEQTPEEAVDALVALALVEPQSGGRLRLHPLLREYAAEKLGALPAAVSEALGDALLSYWQSYAEAASEKGDMAARDAEQVGLMGAIRWAHDHKRHKELLTLAHAMSTFWDVRARLDSQLLVFPWATEAARSLDDKSEVRWALHEVALANHYAGRSAEARTGYERALALARQLGDPRTERAELHGLARLDADAGHMADALAGFEKALALAQQIGDRRAERLELHELALLNALAGRSAEARAGYERALALARQLGDPRAEHAELAVMAVQDANEGKSENARAGFEKALAVARQLGDPAAQSEDLQNLGTLGVRTGRTASSRQELTEALAIARQVQQPRRIAEAVWWLAELDRIEGNSDAACQGFQEAWSLIQMLGNHPYAEITRERLRELGCEPEPSKDTK